MGNKMTPSSTKMEKGTLVNIVSGKEIQAEFQF